MPTGYTAILEDRDDVTFREFCLRCARAMGVCIMQRDDPGDKAMVLDERPSDYHERALNSAREQFALYESMTPERVAVIQEGDLAEARKQADEAIAKKQALQQRYCVMLKKVAAWKPPTQDHQGLKDFMVQQLADSLDWDCDVTYWLNQRQGPVDCEVWLEAKRDKAGKDCDYHAAELLKEVARVTDRNKWKRELVSSLVEEE